MSKDKIFRSFRANQVFGCVSGNPGLFEEFVYQHLQTKGNKYKVLSSSLTEATEMGYVNLDENEEDKMNIFADKYGIHVARLGRGGSMVLLAKGRYVTTDKAYILYLTEWFKNEIG